MLRCWLGSTFSADKQFLPKTKLSRGSKGFAEREDFTRRKKRTDIGKNERKPEAMRTKRRSVADVSPNLAAEETLQFSFSLVFRTRRVERTSCFFGSLCVQGLFLLAFFWQFLSSLNSRGMKFKSPFDLGKKGFGEARLDGAKRDVFSFFLKKKESFDWEILFEKNKRTMSNGGRGLSPVWHRSPVRSSRC